MEYCLIHHGIKGQKWGIRRFQNKDGSLTAKGRVRYNDDEGVSKKSASDNSIKGQKLAIRRFQNKDGSLTAKGKARSGDDKDAPKKSASDHNDSRLDFKTTSYDDLNKAVQRMNLEKRYNELYSEMHPKKFATVRKIVGNAANKVAQDAVNYAVASAFNRITKGKIANGGKDYSYLKDVGKEIKDAIGEDTTNDIKDFAKGVKSAAKEAKNTSDNSSGSKNKKKKK